MPPTIIEKQLASKINSIHSKRPPTSKLGSPAPVQLKKLASKENPAAQARKSRKATRTRTITSENVDAASSAVCQPAASYKLNSINRDDGVQDSRRHLYDRVPATDDESSQLIKGQSSADLSRAITRKETNDFRTGEEKKPFAEWSDSMTNRYNYEVRMGAGARDIRQEQSSGGLITLKIPSRQDQMRDAKMFYHPYLGVG